ncbi:MAG: hypothetical protein HN673_09380, partial [Rhodospirillales bacterium]|nr:hypothetical protein [Rhodospirillales bacterium]
MNKISLPSEKLSLKDAQALFLKDEATTYFSTCTRGLLPSPARAALDVHLEGLQSGLTDKDALFATVEDTRRAFAKLINSDANE